MIDQNLPPSSSSQTSGPTQYFSSFVSVITPNNTTSAFTYGVEKEQIIKVGSLVKVRVKNKLTYGVVTQLKVSVLLSNGFKIKPIIEVFSFCLEEALVKFIIWCAEYNFGYLGMVFKMVIPDASLLTQPERLIKVHTLTCLGVEGLVPPHEEVCDQLSSKANQPQAKAEGLKKLSPRLAHFLRCVAQAPAGLTEEERRAAKVSLAIVRKAQAAGLIETKVKPVAAEYEQQKLKLQPSIELNPSQTQVYQSLLTALKRGAYQTVLIKGVTGSGKTEVYFKLIAECLKRGGNALILVPEIALSFQLIQRFQRCFGVAPYVWHSGISPAAKSQVFGAIVSNNAKVVVGTRSALLLPIKNLKLVVVDEEHEPVYKQDGNFMYHARDAAVVRAKLQGILLVLASATPSIESYYNVKQGKYSLEELTARYNNAQLPTVRKVWFNAKEADNIITPDLEDELRTNLHKGETSMVFLNRRGHSVVGYCADCKAKTSCPECSHEPDYIVNLSYHKESSLLRCHRCGFTQRFSLNCRACGSKDSVKLFGYGIEKVAEEVKRRLPEARVALASSDHLSTVNKAQDLIEAVKAKKIDIIVSTQIMAKGYDFPDLTFVGIVDLTLENLSSDLKSQERALQLLHQVSGRPGRGHKPGRVLLQIHEDFCTPELLERTYEEFLEAELKVRAVNFCPPVGRWASVIVSSASESALKAYVGQLDVARYRLAPFYQKCISPPTKAVYYKMNRRFRYRFLVKTNSTEPVKMHSLIATWFAQVPKQPKVMVKVDVDCVNSF